MDRIPRQKFLDQGFDNKTDVITYAKSKGIRYPNVNRFFGDRNLADNYFFRMINNELDNDFRIENEAINQIYEGVAEFFQIIEAEEEIAQYNNNIINNIVEDEPVFDNFMNAINNINVDARDTVVRIDFKTFDVNGVEIIDSKYYTVNDKLRDVVQEYKNYIDDEEQPLLILNNNPYYEDEFRQIVGYEFIRREDDLARDAINEGAAFNFKLNKILYQIDIFFKRYQIYLDDCDYIERVNSDHNCLIHSLKLNKVKLNELNYLKEKCRSGRIPSKALDEFGKKFKYYFVIQKDTNRYLKYGNKKGKKINLGLLNKHYFIIEKTEITKFSIANYDKVKDYDKWWNINKLRTKNDKIYPERTKDGSNSFQIIKLLLENKDKFLVQNGLNTLDLKLYNKKIYDIDSKLCIKNDAPKYITPNRPYHEILMDKFVLSKKCPNNIKKYLNDYDKYACNIDIFFDFESSTTNTDNKYHEAFLVCYMIFVNNNFYYKSYKIGINCALDFLSDITNTVKRAQIQFQDSIGIGFIADEHEYKLYNDIFVKRRLIAHNISYDFQFILGFMKSLSLVKRSGNKICGGSGTFNNIKYNLLDTYALMPVSLGKFKEFFNFKDDMKKEVIPYSLYNIKKYIDGSELCKISEAEEILRIELTKKYGGDDTYILNKLNGTPVDDKIEKDIKIFRENIVEWNLVRDDKFDQLEYSRIYCERDVDIMQKGYYTFREWNINFLGEDVRNYLTISSLANGYMTNKGCYYECVKLNGMARNFIQKCCVGGRCMSRKNKKYLLNILLNDLDAVSLYPSAMRRLFKELGGYLKGTPFIITKDKLNLWFLEDQTSYFIKIKLNRIPKQRKFPLVSYINKKGVRTFTNVLEEKVYNKKNELVKVIDHSVLYVDKIQLEDIMNFHEVTEADFDIIEGVYFKSGRNPIIGKVIDDVFNERNRFKKLKNPIEQLYKLIMNSSYGKNIMKEVNKNNNYFNDDKSFGQFFKRNYDKISLIEKFGDENYYVESDNPLYNHYNSCHIGCEILSMSKRIMNEVMCLAEDNNIEIYYQDTDSMHIENDKVELLSNLFREKYGRELIGKEMGQFHCDFDALYVEDSFDPKFVDDGTGNKMNKMVDAAYSDKTIILGKKVYIDRVVHKYADKDGKDKINYRYHYRMKGQDSRLITLKAKEKYDCNVFKLYKDLYKGNTLEFNFTDVKVQFKADKLHRCKTLENFKRKVSFL